MVWEEVKELAPLYSIGALDAESVWQIKAFLRQATPEQLREFADWSEVAAMLPLALPSTEPSLRVKTELMKRIASSRTARIIPVTPLPFQPRRRFSQQLLGAASVLLAFITLVLVWQNYKISIQLTNSYSRTNLLQSQLEDLLSPSTRILSMRGVESPNATAKIVWNLEQQIWYVRIHNLPVPPGDQSYQLWYVTKDAKINAAVFSTNESGNHELKLALPAEVAQGLIATAVTLEPKGGSPQPTGKFYLLAQI